MARFRLTVEADLDLKEIGEYSESRWGGDQAARYLSQLVACFQMLATAPKLGRLCDEILEGCWRFPEGRHFVYYEIELEGVLVLRVLHERMQPKRYIRDR